MEIEFADNAESVLRTYATGELWSENVSQNPDVVIMDYHLNSIHKNTINGVEMLDRIKKANQAIPVVMLPLQDKIEVAVNCMKQQAFDNIVKSESVLSGYRKQLPPFFIIRN